MSKQYMIVTDDQILVDMSLIFNSIRDAKGDWEQVERDMTAMLQTLHSMVERSENK